MLPLNPYYEPMSGYEFNTTSQRMELTGLLRVLQRFTEPTQIVCHSDSAYLINTIKRKWIAGWRLNGWKNSKGGDVANRDLWEEIDALVQFHTVSFVKIKGHTGEHFNEMADQVAGQARQDGKTHLANLVNKQ